MQHCLLLSPKIALSIMRLLAQLSLKLLRADRLMQLHTKPVQATMSEADNETLCIAQLT